MFRITFNAITTPAQTSLLFLSTGEKYVNRLTGTLNRETKTNIFDVGSHKHYRSSITHSQDSLLILWTLHSPLLDAERPFLKSCLAQNKKSTRWCFVSPQSVQKLWNIQLKTLYAQTAEILLGFCLYWFVLTNSFTLSILFVLFTHKVSSTVHRCQ